MQDWTIYTMVIAMKRKVKDQTSTQPRETMKKMKTLIDPKEIDVSGQTCTILRKTLM